jgi:hypothetical protein
MTNKSELIKARMEMMGILDEKFKDEPLWRAFRAVDRALAATGEQHEPHQNRMNGTSSESTPTRGSTPRVRLYSKLSYGDLGVEAIERAGKPVSTTEIVSFIAQKRNREPDDIKINIQSALSRDKRIESVHWSGGRGWWLKGQEVPE